MMNAQPVVVLAENDYRYGAGPLRLRIERIDRAAEFHLDGEAWVTVHGTRLRADGTELGPVRVVVRAARLPARGRGA